MSEPLVTELLRPDAPGDFDRAVDLLRRGRLVAVPTETVYGLAADASNPEAVRGIFAAKQRPENHPLIVHLAAPHQLDHWARNIPETARRLAASFWPGPLTLLLHKAPNVSPVVTGGRDTIGLRVPAHPVMHRLLEAFGGGLAAPSANRYQQLSPTSAWQVMEGLGGRIDAVLDGGRCEVGVESTIVDLTGAVPRIVRAGPVTRAALQDALGRPVEFPETHDVAVPGNVAMHYRPRTPLHLFGIDELRARLRAKTDDAPIAVVSRHRVDGEQARGIARIVTMPENKADYAQRLYDVLHMLDAAGVSAIWMEQPPPLEEWRDVRDRLMRAASLEPTPGSERIEGT